MIDPIGSKIARRRGELKLTQSQVADLSGVAQGHLSQIERGERRPSLQTLRKLSDALNVDAETFMQWVDAVSDPKAAA